METLIANHKVQHLSLIHISLAYLREGDTFVIWKLDRLGRSLKDLVYIVDCFQITKVSPSRKYARALSNSGLSFTPDTFSSNISLHPASFKA